MAVPATESAKGSANAVPPLAELHVHIEGTLEPELIYTLAKRNHVALPYADLADLRSRYEFDDLQSFLNLYYANMVVLRTAADFRDLVVAYLERVAVGGVRHADIFFDPQAHLARGVTLSDVTDGLAEGLLIGAESQGISATLIACFLRDRPPVEASQVLAELIAIGAPIVGIGLDSAEVGNPPSLFAEVFGQARAAGLRVVAHAGEEGPASYVHEALELLKVERVDHGIRSLEDPTVVKLLADQQVPLTVCPMSNVRLKAVPDLAAHPLPELLSSGLNVTINSDDPAYFGGYVDDNFRAVTAQFDLTTAVQAGLARNSIRASFADELRKKSLLNEIDEWEKSAT